MIRRIKLPGWIVIIFLFFGVHQAIAQVSKESSEPKDKITDSSVYPGLNIKTETKETNLYTFSVSQPYTENKQINESLDEWINQQKKEFTTEIENQENTLKENEFRAHLNIQLETEKIADKIYTLEFEAYHISGGANGMTKMKPFVIDLNQNKLLQLNDVLQLNETATESIQELILDELHSNPEVSDYIFDDMTEQALKDPEKWDWSVSRQGMTFYFDEYEIAAGAAGAIKVEIPMEKIKPYLNQELAEKINVKLPENEKDNEKEQNTGDIAKLDPDGKYVALTFDDGPHPEVTPRILDELKKHHAKATFFMLGSQVEYYPSLAAKVAEEGHEVANHTMNHQDLTIIGLEQIKEEVLQSSNIIEKATGKAPRLLRPPYGASNDDVEKAAADLEAPIVMWSVDSFDWKSRNAEAVNEEVMSHVVPGSIVLLHDIHSSTADALPQLLTSLEEQGYQMVTISQLLELWNEEGVGPYYGKIG